ncbi:MAG: YbjN domain-containing protein [Erythrobacter sp.]
MRTIIASGLAAIALLGLAAPAAAEVAPVIEQFARADLERALRQAGAELAPAQEGSDRIDFTFDEGVVADALLLACADDAKKKRCLGTSLLATFTPTEGTTPEQIQQAINTYNYNENFGRAYVDPEGAIAVRMYIIADGGITRENYALQIRLWFASVIDFFDYLYGEPGEPAPAT